MAGYIDDFAIWPRMAKYPPGHDVIFSGRFLYGYGWKVPGYRKISIMSDGVEAGFGFTDDESRFAIHVRLPYNPGIFGFRAYYAGCEWIWHAWLPLHLEEILTDPIKVVVSSEPKECYEYGTMEECIATGCHWWDGACHPYPKSGPDWPKIAVVGIATVAGAIVLIAAVKKIKRRK